MKAGFVHNGKSTLLIYAMVCADAFEAASTSPESLSNIGFVFTFCAMLPVVKKQTITTAIKIVDNVLILMPILLSIPVLRFSNVTLFIKTID